MEFYTTGVYGLDEELFFAKITDNNIDVFCDIRRRRGVRGAKYAFVNSNRLQTKLKEINVRYIYKKELSPTKEIRELQKNKDKELCIHKKDRITLSLTFVTEFNSQILADFDFEQFIMELHGLNAKKIILFCVEEHHEACHRSLVADKLQELGYKVTHL